MVAITPIFAGECHTTHHGESSPSPNNTTGECHTTHHGESSPSPNNTSKILWNLDFGHDDSDDNDGDDDDGDDDDDDGDDGEVSGFGGYLQRDIMTGLLGYRLCWDSRKIL
ncbi:hypothetical protein Glove_295g50 [Diversispora epigaea]|uniref:Uncharacterized protein n=1 Tax=Diversispora epigaea TaxID=1348612 RepID=A0A397HZI5_9GLOM|nr:hypothetical protein Glove_295g50 [Diversispora epigaea]